MNKLTLTILSLLPVTILQGAPLPQGQGSQQMPPSFIEYLLRPKFIVMLVIGILVLVLLLTRSMKNSIKIPILLLSTFLFGIAGNLNINAFSSFSMHPSPVCAATKSILYGFRTPMVVTLVVISLLTLVGPKLFCGWICPLGAIQELIAMLADRLKIKRKKFNFSISQGIRVGLFILFIFLSGTALIHVVRGGRVIPVSIYDYVNAFHGLEFGIQNTLLDNIIHFLPFILTVGLAFVLYRPFCYYVCPLGLFTHVLEQVARFRVSLKKSKCNDCPVCIEKSPCPTVPDILKGSTLRPDCFSCNICVKTCPRDALVWGIKRVYRD